MIVPAAPTYVDLLAEKTLRGYAFTFSFSEMVNIQQRGKS